MARESKVAHVVRAGRSRVHVRQDMLIYQAPRGPISVPPADVDIRIATRERLRDLAWFHSPEELKEFERFLDAGHVGYLGYVEGTCVHRTWYVPGPAPIHVHWSQSTQIGANEGYLHYGLTAEDYRGRGIIPVVLAKVIEHHGDRRIITSIARENTSSRRGAEKAGFLLIEEITFGVDLGVTWQRRRPHKAAA